MSDDPVIILTPARPDELPEFVRRLQKAFSVAYRKHFHTEGTVPSDDDVWSSLKGEGAEVLQIYNEGELVGGTVVIVDPLTNHNSLDLLFISPEFHNRRLGSATWRAIEERFPETEVWETVTPYFEKRNIHFYVNRCGFQIVEFFNEHHLDPDRPLGPDEPPEMGEYFRFRKVMNRPETE